MLEIKMVIDINSKAEYPANELSNLAIHPFVLDGIPIQSMESFLQSLKFKDCDKQKVVCSLTGKEAKKIGKRKIHWRILKSLWWKGKKISIFSNEYQILLNRAFDAMFEQSELFRKALEDTKNATLTYKNGRQYIGVSILTEQQFVSCLEKLRDNV